MCVPFSPHPCQYLLLVFFLIVAILTSARCYFIMVLIFISLMSSDAEYFLMCLLPICTSSLAKCLLSFSCLSWGELFFFFLMLSCRNCLYMLGISHLSVISFANIFSHSLSCLFLLSVVSCAVQKLLSLIRSHLFIYFCFYFLYFRIWIQKKITVIYVKGCSACVLIQEFSSLRSLIILRFLCVCDGR